MSNKKFAVVNLGVTNENTTLVDAFSLTVRYFDYDTNIIRTDKTAFCYNTFLERGSWKRVER